jgi:putative ABC transport system ATP-binding protein
VGLSRRATHLPNQLSGGEQQRVAIARALCAEPTILIADEPTGNLDSKTAEVILEILDGLHEAGQTILVVTHSSHVARRCKSQIAIIDGRIRRHAATLIGVA